MFILPSFAHFPIFFLRPKAEIFMCKYCKIVQYFSPPKGHINRRKEESSKEKLFANKKQANKNKNTHTYIYSTCICVHNVHTYAGERDQHFSLLITKWKKQQSWLLTIVLFPFSPSSFSPSGPVFLSHFFFVSPQKKRRTDLSPYTAKHMLHTALHITPYHNPPKISWFFGSLADKKAFKKQKKYTQNKQVLLNLMWIRIIIFLSVFIRSKVSSLYPHKMRPAHDKLCAFFPFFWIKKKKKVHKVLLSKSPLITYEEIPHISHT